MVDIAPSLYERVNESFKDLLERNSKIKAIQKKIKEGGATYEDATEYAIEVGESLRRAFTDITAEALPDGVMYYNIADRVVRPNMVEQHEIVADVAEAVQKDLNLKAGLGLNAIRPLIDNNRIQGIIDKVSATGFNEAKWILGEPVINYAQSVVTEAIYQNAGMHAKIGLRPKIIRTAEPYGVRTVVRGRKRYTYKVPCDWCKLLEGVYDYAEVSTGSDVWRQHENCRCLITYDPGNGKRENVRTKKIYDSQAEAEKENRIELANRMFNKNDPTLLKDRANNYELSVGSGRRNTFGKNLKDYQHDDIRNIAKTTPKGRLSNELAKHAENIDRLEDKLKNTTRYVPDYYDKSEKIRRELTRKWERQVYQNKDALKIKYEVYEELYL